MKELIVVVGIFVSGMLIGCGGEKSTDAKTEVPAVEMKNTSASTKKLQAKEMASLTSEQKLGKRLFIMCEACHNVKEGEPHKVGPNLHGVFGRKAGTLSDFKYSEAVLNADITWSDETIREWLINPNDYIKGTNMVFVGLPKKRQQDALLAYLHHVAE